MPIPQPAGLVGRTHFRLLREFGRNPLSKSGTKEEQETIWQMVCQSARVAYVPRDQVVEIWRQFVQGESERSGIAMAPGPDPAYVTVGVCFDKKVVASHTLPLDRFLVTLLRLFAKRYKDVEAYGNAMEKVAEEAWRTK